ncbi:unannotated protein [freshwater metagenome]|uniref:Unannotated protein n=1 Tax=freshwater metagenome TaxID=449393 RepID=A0A6J7XXW9_9ZZZZ
MAANLLAVPETLIVIFLGLLGLVFGSFTSVLVHRVPNRESIMGRSKCPHCGNEISAKYNIPIIGYLLARGRCSKCAQMISLRYPLLELGTSLTVIVVGFATSNYYQFFAWEIFAIIGLALSVIDLQLKRLPDLLTFPLFIIGLLILTLQSWSDNNFEPLVRALECSAALTLFYLITMIASRGGMGMGDVKLGLSIGLFTGYLGATTTFISSMISFLLGSIVGLLAMILGKATRKTGIPFGPFMIIGALLGPWITQIVKDFYSLS